MSRKHHQNSKKLFEGNKTKNAFEAHNALMKFKLDSSMNVEDFLVEFQIKVNKVKASGTTLPDGVLGYTLLNRANLHSDKVEMIRATCAELDFNTVKAQLEKIGLGKSSSSHSNDTIKYSSSKSEPSSSIKVEELYYGHYDSDSSDEEDLAV